jgi:hypothetical protein
MVKIGSEQYAALTHFENVDLPRLWTTLGLLP